MRKSLSEIDSINCDPTSHREACFMVLCGNQMGREVINYDSFNLHRCAWCRRRNQLGLTIQRKCCLSCATQHLKSEKSSARKVLNSWFIVVSFSRLSSLSLGRYEWRPTKEFYNLHVCRLQIADIKLIAVFKLQATGKMFPRKGGGSVFFFLTMVLSLSALCWMLSNSSKFL